MPRKPKLPVPVLRIEGLSDGREIRSEVVAGDFGEVVPVVRDTRSARYVLTPEDIEAKAARDRAEQHKAVMVLAGWGDKVGYVAPPAKPKLAYNQRVIKAAGQEFIITITNTSRKPFLRRI